MLIFGKFLLEKLIPDVPRAIKEQRAQMDFVQNFSPGTHRYKDLVNSLVVKDEEVDDFFSTESKTKNESSQDSETGEKRYILDEVITK